MEMTLDQDAQGAPPLGTVDLDKGVVIVRPVSRDSRPEHPH